MTNKTDIESALNYVSESDSITKFIEDLVSENKKLNLAVTIIGNSVNEVVELRIENDRLNEISSEPELHIHALNITIADKDSEIEQLKKRLEISDTGYDGIECRDRTIQLLEGKVKELEIDLDTMNHAFYDVGDKL